MSPDDNHPVIHHLRLMLSYCSLTGEGEGSFNPIIQPYQVEPIADVGERDMTEEDEDDEDGTCFATLESQFENKEIVGNW